MPSIFSGKMLLSYMRYMFPKRK